MIISLAFVTVFVCMVVPYWLTMRHVAALSARIRRAEQCIEVVDDAMQYLKVDIEKLSRQRDQSRHDEDLRAVMDRTKSLEQCVQVLECAMKYLNVDLEQL